MSDSKKNWISRGLSLHANTYALIDQIAEEKGVAPHAVVSALLQYALEEYQEGKLVLPVESTPTLGKPRKT